MDSLLLHEMPLLQAWKKRLSCLLKGGHKHIYIGRTCLHGNYYSLHYICEHCRHFKWLEEEV